jgi:hypothetical protein
MLAATGSHHGLVGLAAVTVVMSAPSYARPPRWFGAATGAALVLVGFRLLALSP